MRLYYKSNTIKKIILKMMLKGHFLYRELCFSLVNFLSVPLISPRYGAHLFFLKHIKPGDFVLDIGCGSGEITYLLASRAKHIDAFDISEKNIKYARKNRSLPNITYRLGEANSIINSLTKNYNVTVLSSILTFVDNPKRFLSNLANITDLIICRETKFDNDILVLFAEELGIKKSRWFEFKKNEFIELITSARYKIIDEFDTYNIFIAAVPQRAG